MFHSMFPLNKLQDVENPRLPPQTETLGDADTEVSVVRSVSVALCKSRKGLVCEEQASRGKWGGFWEMGGGGSPGVAPRRGPLGFDTPMDPQAHEARGDLALLVGSWEAGQRGSRRVRWDSGVPAKEKLCRRQRQLHSSSHALQFKKCASECELSSCVQE